MYKCNSTCMSLSSQDGITHQNTPFLNILCSGVHNHNALLQIIDCTDHCAEANKKDAQYIADTMKPHIMKLDPTKECVDFVIFDGTSNVDAFETLNLKKFGIDTSDLSGKTKPKRVF